MVGNGGDALTRTSTRRPTHGHALALCGAARLASGLDEGCRAVRRCPARRATPGLVANRGLLRCNRRSEITPEGRVSARSRRVDEAMAQSWEKSGRARGGSEKRAGDTGRTVPHALAADFAGWRPAGHTLVGTARPWLPARGGAAAQQGESPPVSGYQGSAVYEFICEVTSCPTAILPMSAAACAVSRSRRGLYPEI